jgi:nucleotide-binding universal stress UspA family protein
MANTAQGTGGRVVVAGYDGSATAKAAVDYAARQAGPDGRVVVVHSEDRNAALNAALINGLALGDDPLLDTNWDAETVDGPPARALLEAAHAHHADSIVVGSHGRGRLTTAALGSVAHELLRQSDVPVTVVPRAAVDAVA